MLLRSTLPTRFLVHSLPRFSFPSRSPTSRRPFSSSPPSRSSAPIARQPPHPQRALLYVPGSSPASRLDKCLSNGLAGEDGLGQPDVLILDLEDSVRDERKSEARAAVVKALEGAPADCLSRKYVRINSSKLGFDDLEAVLKSPNLDGLVLPKVHTASDLAAVDSFISQYGLEGHRDKLKIVASIESPLGLLNMREICGVTKRLAALLFAAEDYCASSLLLRTPSLTELTYARQSLVAHARAFGLTAVDLVCVHYKGDEALATLRREAEEGRRWGFGGKQCIHPGQVREVMRAFAPSAEEIDRARRILTQYAAAKDSGAGVYGLEEKGGGGTVMIDAPMLLQAKSILAQARSAGFCAMSTRTIPGAAPAAQLTKKQAAAQRKAAAAGPALGHGKGDPAATVVEAPKKGGKDDHASGRPDKASYDKEQDELRAQIDVLQAKQNDLRARISSSAPKSSPEHERKLAVRKELDALRTEQAARKGGRGKTLDNLKALQDAVGKKIKDLQAAKTKAPFKTVQEVENQIKALERQVESGQMKLVEEKKALAEISSLRKSRKLVESFAAQQDAIDADKAKVDEVRKELDDPEHKALNDKFDALRKELDEINKKMDETSKVRDGLFEERNAVSKQLDDLFTQKKASAAAFREANNKYYQKLNDDRIKRDERRRAERKAADEGKRAEINRQLLEEAQAPAFEREIEDCRTLILHFQQRIGLAPASSSSSSNGSLFARAEVAGVPKLEIRQVDKGDLPKGVALKKKGEQEEESWGGLAPKKGKKGGKKSPAPGASTPASTDDGAATPTSSVADEKLNLPFGTLTALMSLGITAPLTTSEVQVTIDSLNLKKKYFTDNQARVTKERVEAVEAKIRKAEEKAANGKGGAADEEDDVVDEVQAVADAEPTEAEEKVKDAQPQPIEEGGSKEEAVKNAEGNGVATEAEVKEAEKLEDAAEEEGKKEEDGEKAE
ncbi:hypothetical protein JCM6882_005204 [Rhodosporidiobolus microsporus]